VEKHPLWYHTMELGPGVITPGWFDLRPISERLPWPDVRGKRCLDVGTYDGFLAFELERRGADEVVATDLADHTEWDWPPESRQAGPEHLARMAGPKGSGFEIAKEALSSSAELVQLSVYELSPERVGTFDVVVCGTLLLHLRDPIRALEAVRGVCRGKLLSTEQIDPQLSLLHPRRPVARLDALAGRGQWWIGNRAAHRRMVRAAGFAVECATRPYVIPFGPGHRLTRQPEPRRQRSWSRRILGGSGIPSAAVVASPRF